MTTKIWYEGSADKPAYMYFQHFGDMASVDYRFGTVYTL